MRSAAESARSRSRCSCNAPLGSWRETSGAHQRVRGILLFAFLLRLHLSSLANKLVGPLTGHRVYLGRFGKQQDRRRRSSRSGEHSRRYGLQPATMIGPWQMLIHHPGNVLEPTWSEERLHTVGVDPLAIQAVCAIRLLSWRLDLRSGFLSRHTADIASQACTRCEASLTFAAPSRFGERAPWSLAHCVRCL